MAGELCALCLVVAYSPSLSAAARTLMIMRGPKEGPERVPPHDTHQYKREPAQAAPLRPSASATETMSELNDEDLVDYEEVRKTATIRHA